MSGLDPHELEEMARAFAQPAPGAGPDHQPQAGVRLYGTAMVAADHLQLRPLPPRPRGGGDHRHRRAALAPLMAKGRISKQAVLASLRSPRTPKALKKGLRKYAKKRRWL